MTSGNGAGSTDQEILVENLDWDVNFGERAGFNSAKHLGNARDQAIERGFDNILIIDVDAHHYESSSMPDFMKYIEDPVLRHTALGLGLKARGMLFYGGGAQDNAGRLLRYRGQEEAEGDTHVEVTKVQRAREAIGIDYQIVFPTAMFRLAHHPDPSIEVAFSYAYTKWWVEEILPQDPRLKTMVYLPLNDVEASMRVINEFGDHPDVVGFVVGSPQYTAVHDNRYMPIYAELEARDLPIGFHANWNPQERILNGMNKFLSVHAIAFALYNIIHTTNLVINGIPERFPRLKIIMIESGLAWIPWLMQRLDNEYEMRTNEAPLLRKKPSEYMSENLYYSTQPIELGNMEALELTMKMINADSQLMFTSDWPHWDFNLPSTIWDLPFLSEDTKLNILGRTALKVFPKLADAVQQQTVEA